MRIVVKVGTSTLTHPTGHMATKQAAAAVGQCELMYVYDRLFGTYNHTIAQILLTGEDLRDEERYRNFSNTVGRLLELGVLPVINENDTVSTVEIAVGDNDTLGALVAVSVKADMLMILSDIDGLYTADPRREKTAKLISEVKEITPEMLASAGGGGTALATGGMATKLTAAGICMESGTDMFILNGAKPLLLYEALEGKPVGTKFIGREHTP